MSTPCSCLTCQRHPRRAFDADKDRRRIRREAQALSDYGDNVARVYLAMRLAEVAQHEAFARAHLSVAKEIQRMMLSEMVGDVR